MTSPLWLPPLIKALATALLVVSASAVAEALGAFWGALVATLPVSSGPAYVFLAMQHDANFVGVSALSSFAANAAVGVFLITYCVAAPRMAAWPSLFAAALAWAGAIGLVQTVAWTEMWAFVLNLVVYGVGIATISTTATGAAKATPPARRRFELLARAVIVAGFVSLVVGLSTTLGPNATGTATVFPVSLISMLVILRGRLGGAQTALFAANALRPMLGFGMALLTLHLASAPLGTTTALSLALLVSVLWSAGLLLLKRWQRRAAMTC